MQVPVQQIGLTERQPDGSWRIVKVVTSQAEADAWLLDGELFLTARPLKSE